MSVRTTLRREESIPPDSLLSLQNRKTLSSSAEVRREIKRQLYALFEALTGWSFPWGSLTGIRPTQIAQMVRETSSSDEEAKQALVNVWRVHPNKADLALKTAEAEQNILEILPQNTAMAYFGIPFCPSRCAYCSFISRDAFRQKEYLEPYVEAMIKETENFFAEKKQPVSAIYYGGGTPTSLDDELFQRLMLGTLRAVPHDKQTEITVEAGRPETITREKLMVLRELGVQDICINPQTMHDETLHRIGRRHTVKNVLDSVELARACGMKRINMDLILGLPGETADDFIASLRRVIELEPERITIHTLALKRSATLNLERRDRTGKAKPDAMPPDPELEHVLDEARQSLEQEGLYPYYLYKQKYVRGGLENVGFSKREHACYYNVGMMSDRVSVYGFGSGATSKRVEGDRVERCHNSKDLLDYLRRVDEMIERKRMLFV